MDNKDCQHVFVKDGDIIRLWCRKINFRCIGVRWCGKEQRHKWDKIHYCKHYKAK